MEQEQNSAELCSGRMFGCDINKLPGYEKDKAAIKLIVDFCLIHRNGRDMEGQKKKLPFLALWRSRRDHLLDFDCLFGAVPCLKEGGIGRLKDGSRWQGSLPPERL